MSLFLRSSRRLKLLHVDDVAGTDVDAETAGGLGAVHGDGDPGALGCSPHIGCVQVDHAGDSGYAMGCAEGGPVLFVGDLVNCGLLGVY